MADAIAMLREEAQALLDAAEHPADVIAMRSCWECNPAHEHFKETHAHIVLNCFICGGWFYKGRNLTERNPPAELEAGGHRG